ncbi:MAG: hypothetical protein QW292_09310 [Candidatus Parvarchaeota archaeon]
MSRGAYLGIFFGTFIGGLILYLYLISLIAPDLSSNTAAGYGGLLSFITALGIVIFLRVRERSVLKRKQITGHNVFTMIGKVVEVRHGRSEEQVGVEPQAQVYDYPIPIDFYEYMKSKGTNWNMAIVGMPGSGKTELQYFLIQKMQEKFQGIVIFTIKNTDRYTELGIPTLFLKDFSPDVFLDKNAFIESWLSAFSPDSIGITAQQVEGSLWRILRKMQTHTWREFEKILQDELEEAQEERNLIEIGALKNVQGNLYRVMNNRQYSENLPQKIVIDFEGLSDRAVAFYGEYLMRQLFEEVKSGKRQGTAFFMDESQIFMKSGKSIMMDLAALIRSTGAFVFSTQELETIAGVMKGAAGTQWSFKQTEHMDLKAAGAINPLYQWILPQLPPYAFVDLAQSGSQDGIYVFRIVNPHPTFMPPIEWKPKEEVQTQERQEEAGKGEGREKGKGKEKGKGVMVMEEALSEEGEEEDEPDLKEKVFSIISEAPVPPTLNEIAKYLAKETGKDEKSYRLMLLTGSKKSPLTQLIQEGKVTSFSFDFYDRPGWQQEKVVYYASGTYQAHDYLVKYISSLLYQLGYNPEIQEHGIATPDLIAHVGDKKIAIEVEMDTKAGEKVEETKMRIRKLRQDGYQVIMIGPSEESVNHLKKLYSDIPEMEIFTPREFKKYISTSSTKEEGEGVIKE